MAVIGANSEATPAVPLYWNRKRLIRITSVIGTTKGDNPVLMTLRPSTAESTDMAGVIMASPKKKAAPIMPSVRTNPLLVLSSVSTSTTSERIPPSPRLSARMRKKTYFSVTIRISAQISSEATPRTAARRSPPAATTGCRASRMA